MVEVNRNVDSDFYEELFTMKGGVAHNDSRNRRKETGSPIDLSVNLEDYISCLDVLSD